MQDDNAAKNFDILATSLSVLHNYFGPIIWMDPTKLFLDLYLVNFLDTPAKPFFPCTILRREI